MLFNSLKFIFFFPVVVLLYFIMPHRLKNYWLLVASYFFYMCWNAKYALLLLFSTIVTYTSGIFIEKIKRANWDETRKNKFKKAAVAFSIILNLAILFYFKYTNFALETLGKFLEYLHIDLRVPTFDILLPVGISFYIFQALGYTMDVYRNEIYAEKNFFQYALFVSFFPQLVAGPIERSKNLLKQFAEPKSFSYDSVRRGLLLMLWGYFLKVVISDRCAVLVNTVYGSYRSYRGYPLILATVLFAFQIYCDFMGYSVIAKGAAKVLGYDLMDNFLQPYLSRSIKDFWRRWHISLSTWLRDYLYIPLGGNRKSKLTKHRNLMITFLASGLWHGASLNFVVWGGMHGLYQIVEEIISPFCIRICDKLKFNRKTFSWKLAKLILNFILVDIAWVFFRADSISMALEILRNSMKLSPIGWVLNGGLFELGLDGRNIIILTVSLLVLLLVSYMKEHGIHVLEWLSGQNFVFRYLVYWSAVILIIFSLDITGQDFIYFQF